MDLKTCVLGLAIGGMLAGQHRDNPPLILFSQALVVLALVAFLAGHDRGETARIDAGDGEGGPP